jgi:hypothetical protein
VFGRCNTLETAVQRDLCPIKVASERLRQYLFQLTIAGTMSARDVQFPQTQFFKRSTEGAA